MKAALAAIGLLAFASIPAMAGSCAEELKALDSAIAAQAQIEPDVKAQVQDMRAQAEKLCAAGNEEEAADVISEATSMLTAQ